MKNFETIIFENLLQQTEYCQAVVSFIKREYFGEEKQRLLFDFIQSHYIEFKKLPSKTQLLVELDSQTNLNEDQFNNIKEIVDNLEKEEQDLPWLLKETELWAQDKAMYHALVECINISEGKSEQKAKADIPNIMTDALSISLDQHIGHDFFSDVSERWDAYWHQEDKIPFGLDMLNSITNGGLPSKTLTLFFAATGGGKSLVKCHIASDALLNGYNVLYITMELSEEKVAERIDANILDTRINDLKNIEKSKFVDRLSDLKKKSSGRLFIKEYPSGSAGVSQFRYLVRELAIKKKFKPDIILIDYLNICCSSRLNRQAKSSTYDYIKSVTEEVRGFAQELNLPIVSSTQLNREGMSSSDPGLENTSESMGISFTADLIIAMVADEKLKEQGLMMCKQLKNRLNDDSINRKFMLNVDRSKMKLSDCQTDEYISEANPAPIKETPQFRKGREKRDLSALKT